MKQRDNLWRQQRLGDVTASRFKDVLAQPSAAGVFAITGRRSEYCVAREGEVVSGEFSRKADATERRAELVAEWQKTNWSQSAESYLDEKLAELIHCVPSDVWRSDATDWGTANEPYGFEAAIPVVEALFGQKLSLPVDEFAYVQHPTEPHIGCSPDGLIGNDGLCELKCPFSGAKWIRAKRFGLTVPKENIAQVQGQLWATGRKWSMFGYFDPRVRASGLDPLLHTIVLRDESYIQNTLAPRVTTFRDYLYAEYDKLIGKGVF